VDDKVDETIRMLEEILFQVLNKASPILTPLHEAATLALEEILPELPEDIIEEDEREDIVKVEKRGPALIKEANIYLSLKGPLAEVHSTLANINGSPEVNNIISQAPSMISEGRHIL